MSKVTAINEIIEKRNLLRKCKEKAIDKINQAIFLIKPYFEGNLEAKRFTLKYLQDALKELEDDYES